jgi:2-hydroxy-3-keto-5-methylthiopentenyl-1-phosphate phosphatase
MAEAKYRSVLVTDFDGTLTEHDYYKLVRDRLVPPDTPDFWAAWREGRMTHFQALRAYFDAARPDAAAHVALVDEMGLDPGLAEGVASLNAAGWRVVVVSYGCLWYIDRLLKGAGVDLEVHANPGALEGGRLALHRPAETPFPSEENGISKESVIRSHQEEGLAVAFAGDGPADLEPALLVPPGLRFARADLADALRRRGADFRPFDRWSEIARALADEALADEAPADEALADGALADGRWPTRRWPTGRGPARR